MLLKVTVGLPACYDMARSVLVVTLSIACAFAAAPIPDVKTIIQRSVDATNADWNAATRYDFTEQDRTPHGSVTFRVRMIDGSQYYEKIAVNGKPLSGAEAQAEKQKLEDVIAKRGGESPREREDRIAKYQADRRRDHLFMSQLTEAFDFAYQRQENLEGYHVFVLRATPKPGYKPPTMEAQALKGMAGTMWIDTNSYQWVKVEAHVVHPVSIEGFLAEVEPGTRFELDSSPVTGGIWLPTHFVMRSRSKILYVISHQSQANETYSSYRPASSSAAAATRPATPPPGPHDSPGAPAPRSH